MAWNQPGNNGHDRDPWGSVKKNSNNSNSTNEKEKKSYTFNFNSTFCNLVRKLIKIYNNSNNDLNNNLSSKKNTCSIILSIVVIFIIWACSGFYTIKEAERGVVLRFGKFNHLVQPGLNWKPNFIDTVTAVNVESVRELAASGIMLTSDENVVRVEMNVQYHVTDPKLYLFSVIKADDSLRQATDSALRGVIGKYTMDRILTEGRTLVRSDTQHVLEETIYPYHMGITLLDVNFQAARPPEEVKAAFDDAIAARENEQQYIREAEAYANEVQPRANGRARRILEEANAYKACTVLEAKGEVQRFIKVLPEYKTAPKITRERLYIDTMERVLSNTRKILVNNKISNNMMVLSLDHAFQSPNNNIISNHNSDLNRVLKKINTNGRAISKKAITNTHSSVMERRLANAQRNYTTREWKE